VLTSLLPGLREIRAPLASGYLWLLVVWLLIEPHLAAKQENMTAIVASLTRLAEAASPVGVGAAATFVAYVMGSLSEAIAQAGVNLVAGRPAARLPRWLKKPRIASVDLGFISVLLELDPTALASSEEAHQEVEMEVQGQLNTINAARRHLAESMSEVRAQIAKAYQDASDSTISIGEPETWRSFVTEREQRLASLEEEDRKHAWEERLIKRRADEVRSALEDRPIAPELLRRLQLSRRGHRSVEALVREKRNVLLPQLTREGISVSEALGQEMAGRIKTTGSVTSALFAQVLDEFDLATTRLIGDQPELFSAIDRPRAEAEFRFALVPPLVALTVVLVALTDNVTWIIGLAVPIALFFQGFRRRRTAGDLLADALYLGRIEAPVLDRLEKAAGDRRVSETQ
jgi:hypothetical protein